MKVRNLIALFMGCTLALCACETHSESAPDFDVNEIPEVAEPINEESVEVPVEAEDDKTDDKQVIVYFPNWNLEGKEALLGGEVANIDWENVTFINHAFWAVEPDDGSTLTSFEQRSSGLSARTKFRLVSTEPKADLEDNSESALVEGLPRNHFAEYAYFSEKYPDVNILISIGGWSRCGYMSEMAYTPEGRTSFVNACVDLINKYPWIDGIDIDWEYPGGSKDGERLPESDTDQGCPIFGTARQDNVNFAALLEELRQTLDDTFGIGVKKLTACASASTGWTLPMQDWVLLEPNLDYINIMTYDLAGLWDGCTGHASSFWSAKAAAVYFYGIDSKISRRKLNIGSPMYSTSFLMTTPPSSPVSAVGNKIEKFKPTQGEINESDIKVFEAQAVSGYTCVEENGIWKMGESFDNGAVGWHMGYDSKKDAAYIYNDDPASDYYLWYLSYENHLSLQKKLDFINESGIAGVIVWESSQDTPDHEFISQMGNYLLK